MTQPRIDTFCSKYDKKGDLSFKNLLFVPQTKIKTPFGIYLKDGEVSLNLGTTVINSYSTALYAVYAPFEFERSEIKDNSLTLKFEESDTFIKVNNFRSEPKVGQISKNTFLGFAGKYSEGDFVLDFELYGDEFMLNLMKEKFSDIPKYDKSFLSNWFEINRVPYLSGIKKLKSFCEDNSIEEFNSFYIKKKTESNDSVYYYNYYALF